MVDILCIDEIHEYKNPEWYEQVKANIIIKNEKPVALRVKPGSCEKCIFHQKGYCRFSGKCTAKGDAVE